MSLWYELNYSLRLIRKKFGFSVLCVVVIALGYAITLPLYSFVKNFAYADLPFPDGDRVVMLKQVLTSTNADLDSASFDFYQFNALAENAESFDSISVFREEIITLSDGEYAQQITGGRITAETLNFAAPVPLLGRSFLPSDAIPEADPVVLLGYDVWQNYYGGDSDVVGSVGRVNGQPHTIIGVMAQGFRFPQSADIWLPMTITNAEPGTTPLVSIFGMLKEGTSRSVASAELAAIMQRLSIEFPAEYEEKSARVVPLTQGFFNNALAQINSIGGLALCIYLLVVLNVGNLLMIRANERVGELAIRSAMGASRLRLILNILTESFLVCFFGAVIGLAIAGWLLNTLSSFLFELFFESNMMPFWWDFSINMDVLLTSLLMLVVLWLLAGSFSAWRASHNDISVLLGGDSKGVVLRGSSKVTSVLVQIQIVLSFFLMVLSGTYLFVFQGVYQESSVAGVESYVMANINIENELVAGSEGRELYQDALEQAVESIIEFEALTYASSLPGEPTIGARVGLIGSELPSGEIQLPYYGVSWVESDYFQSLGFSLQEGRHFDESDTSTSEAVVIVDEEFVKRMGLVGKAIGQRLDLYSFQSNVRIEAGGVAATIVGVVPYAGQINSGNFNNPQIYRPLNQETPSSLMLIAKIRPDIQTPIAELEQRVRIAGNQINRDISIDKLRPLSLPIYQENSARNMFATFFGSAAVGALFLAVIGIYGLVSRAVFSRSNEIGIRRAIGSTNFAIAKIFLAQVLFYLTIGIVFGGGIAVLAIDLIEGSLSASNMITTVSTVFVSVTAIVTALICYATYVPVRNIVAMEPGEALHYE